VNLYTLLAADGTPYRSDTPGTLGGHRRGRLYGRLDCPSALRAVAAGGYVADRVFFADEPTAIAAGYRPCAICLPARYGIWRALTDLDAHSLVIGTARDDDSVAAGTFAAELWVARGGVVLDTVTWPETAASWLRQARRFTAPHPDVWFVAATQPGWLGMRSRLTRSTDWDPQRTIERTP
jgi:hypothetical protein